MAIAWLCGFSLNSLLCWWWCGMLAGCSSVCLFNSLPSFVFSSPKVNYPDQMHAVEKNDISMAEDQKPWAEEQQPHCLFIWFWHVNEDVSDLALTHCVPPWPWPRQKLTCIACDGPSQEVSGKFPAYLLNSENLSCFWSPCEVVMLTSMSWPPSNVSNYKLPISFQPLMSTVWSVLWLWYFFFLHFSDLNSCIALLSAIVLLPSTVVALWWCKPYTIK